MTVEPGGRVAPAVESAAYFVVAEALTNAVKHSGATRLSVDVTRDGNLLVVQVADDGDGGADADGQRPDRPAQAHRGARRRAADREPARRADAPARGDPVRVVIAEDLALLRDGLTRLLTESGFEVVAAVEDGPGLVRAVMGHKPDVCVVDVRLPPTFTDEGVRAALEARTLMPGLPVLVLSQYVERTFAAELLSDGRGGVGYLLKDRVADVREFVDAVRRVAEGGTAMDPEAVAQLLGGRGEDSVLDELTPREREVLGLMAEGRTNHAIAERLVVTEGAVEKHVSNIFGKLGLPPVRRRPPPRAGRPGLGCADLACQRLTRAAAHVMRVSGRGAPNEDRGHDRSRLERARGARPDGRGRDGRRSAELQPRHRRAACADGAAGSARRPAGPGAPWRSCRTSPARNCASARCGTGPPTSASATTVTFVCNGDTGELGDAGRMTITWPGSRPPSSRARSCTCSTVDPPARDGTRAGDGEIDTEVEVGGTVASRQGLNIPGETTDLPPCPRRTSSTCASA